jgi:hypothetical protein
MVNFSIAIRPKATRHIYDIFNIEETTVSKFTLANKINDINLYLNVLVKKLIFQNLKMRKAFNGLILILTLTLQEKSKQTNDFLN